MSIERVREYFSQFHIENRIQEFSVSSATVELAAEALHTEGKRIAKTLSCMVDGTPIPATKRGLMFAKVGNNPHFL